MAKAKIKYVRLSERWMYDNRYLMGKLSPMQRLLFFAVFTAMKWSCRYKPEDILYIPGDTIREYTHSTMSDKQLAKALSSFGKVLTEAYGGKTKEYFHAPYEYIGFKHDHFCFKLLDCDVFQPPKDSESRYITLNLTEIASYKTGHKVNCKAIPLLWYVLCSQFPEWRENLFESEYPPILQSHIELDVGDMELKTILGLSKYDYLYIPHGNEELDIPYNRLEQKRKLTVRDFYVDFDQFATKRDNREFRSYNDQMNAEDALTETYNHSIQRLQSNFNDLKKDAHYLRWHFEQTVLNPAIEEINKFGSMVRFIEQERFERSEHLTFAHKVKSSYSKNYTMHDQWKNVKNFRKLEAGRQYHFVINVLEGKEDQSATKADEFEETVCYDSATGMYHPLVDAPAPVYYDDDGFVVGSIISDDEDELPFF